jgi:hypothetical protein
MQGNRFDVAFGLVSPPHNGEWPAAVSCFATGGVPPG